MNFFKNIRLNIKSAIFLLLFLVLVFLISGYFEYRSRQREVLDLMNTMTGNIISTVKKSAVNSILSYDYIDSRNSEYMKSLLVYLDNLESNGQIKRYLVDNLIEYSNLEQVSIFDGDARQIYASNKENWISDEQLASFMQSGDSLRSIINDGDLSMLLKRSEGGAIIGLFDRESLRRFQNNLGIGKFINDVSADSSVIYIAIQDLEGIIAGSKRLDSLTAIDYDPFLKRAYLEKQFDYRVKNYKNQKIYESVMPFDILQTYYGIIRIGLSYEPLQNVKNAAMRNVFIRLIILTVVGFIVISYAMSRNTIESLQQEKERITREVYELQKSLREKEKQNAIHQLAAGIAHEIGNPLNALSLNVQRLHRNLSSDHEDDRKLLTLIKNEVKRIDRIIKQFLNFSKPIPLEMEQVELNKLINEVSEVYDAILKEKEISLFWNPNSQMKVEADREKLYQALINILQNAIEALPNGGEITIDLREKQENIEIEISDNGPGIAAEDQSKIFNLFYTTKDDGTGIGLSQVYKIIQNHGGDINFHSELGAGTTFVIQLPKK